MSTPAPRSFYGSDPETTVAAALDGDPPPSAEAPIEAPVGQRDDSVRQLAERTHTSPEDAEPLVAQGAYTHEQAANLARGGKIEALTYDAATGRVGCRSPKGVTAAIRHAQTVWAGAYAVADESEDTADSWADTLGSAVVGAGSAVGGAVGWAWGTAKGKAVKRLAQAVVGKNPAVLMFAAGPSVYRALVTGETSYRQATKDLFEAGAGAAGGAAGAAAGAAVGATVGSIVPIFGTFIGGAIGGLTGGLLGAGFGERGGELLSDSFAPDDADALRPLATDELAALAFAHALVPAEVERLKTAAETATTEETLRLWFKLYTGTESATGREPAMTAVRTAARELYEPLLQDIVADRPLVTMPVEG
ncbi:hypothetical protein [Alienimonas chondri]|uniref:Glycine zipper domain-containing protein n=1 Tax=Alienimonas chondri TaxID=2681879 RepID=A0ABX1VCP7_9PLAN|nr:hypothetical protein [Alienimonas chondri]NNJ25884.1 hypothetical protein [Alienimonas chondri]